MYSRIIFTTKNTHHIVKMKKNIIFILIIFIFSSCEKQVQDGIPSYIRINSFNLITQQDEGEATTNITDAWVYIDDNIQGIYELPAHFPVLEEGQKSLKIFAGIKDNGISASRLKYPFYKSFQTITELQKDSTTNIEPIVNYFDWTEFEIEDFDESGILFESDAASDTTFFKLVDPNDSTNNYGAVNIINPDFFFKASTKVLEDLPQAGLPVYLEMDYRCNTNFIIGVYSNYPNTVVPKNLFFANPKEEWNKIYINLTSTISEAVGASSFKIYIEMQRPYDLEKAELYIDNFKIIY